MIKDRLFNDKLEIEVNLIGYDNLGESIVFFIECDGRIDFVGVIDCYYRGNMNKTMELLDKAGRCDFLCWTHKHTDHSKGIAEILQFCDESTGIYITPSVYPQLLSDTKSVTKEVKKIRDVISTRMSSKNCESLRIFRAFDALKLCEIVYRSNDRKYRIEMSSFCPNDFQLIQRDFRGKKNDDNVSSVGLTLRAGLFNVVTPIYNIIFSSDVEDVSLKNLSGFSDTFMHPTYVKIPHHASSSSKYMLDLLRQEDRSNIQVATTTVYDRYNLPDKDILRSYKQINDNRVSIYATKDIDEKGNNMHKYGIVRTVFDVCDSLGQGVESYTEGDAVLWQ